ncbi:MAG: NHLP leader peptide family RiPP precursor [Nitrospira sp.]|nr:NHLP leader peptide family RiPP precursor [Nitrospira sp.]
MKTAEEIRSHLTEKAAADSDFRQQLVADPKGAINREFGITIPDSMDVRVHQSDMQTIHLALPPTENLTEEQLEAVAAGLCCCT